MAKRAAHAWNRRIAVVFDLDDTLAPDTYGSVVERCCEVDPETFERERVQKLRRKGWNETLAKFFCLIEESERKGGAITQEQLAAVGRGITLFEGVPEMFDRLRRVAGECCSDAELEFYLLSGGLLDVAAALPIADRFEKIWACEFHYGERGEVKFIKRVVTFPEKVRYLLALSKGMDEQDPDGRPSDVYRPLPESELYVPLDQVVYVGDGASDMPAFELMNEQHGIAIGVYKQKLRSDWPGYKEVRDGTRVQNLARVDFREGSELMQSLTLAVEQICKRIALRKLARGE
jgi:phosphoglycolate phosphatase-like HAD superfamily hydrolase